MAVRLALAAALVLGLTLPASAAALPGSLSGDAFDAASSAPVSGLCVEAARSDGGGTGSGTATTGPTGHFTVVGLEPGTYRVKITDCRPDPRYSPNTDGWGSVSDAQDTCCIQAAMKLFGAIGGDAFDIHHSPIGGLCAEAFDADGAVAGRTLTGSDGKYVIARLPEGNYTVRFSDCTSEEPYWETQWYFHDPVRPGPPFTVSVRPGETQTRVDAFYVRLVPAIVGTITAEGSGEPIAQYCARLWQGDRYVPGYWVSDGNGRFVIRRDDGSPMPGGPYQIQFADCSGGNGVWLAEWYDDSYRKESSTQIQIGDRGTTVVNGSLSRGAEISGTVTLQDGSRPTGLPGLCAGAVPLWAGEAGKPVEQTDVFTNGQYAIRALPGGEYKVRFARCHDSVKIPTWATQWWQGAPSFALGQTVSLAKQGSVTGIDAVMSLAPEPVRAQAAKKCIVPRLGGLTVRQARRKLHRAGCSLGRITRVRARGRHGRVLSSRARAGRHLPRWTKVALRVVR